MRPAAEPEAKIAKIVVLIPEPWYGRILLPAARARLAALGTVRWAGADPRRWDVPQLLADADICLTGWGTPPLVDDLLSSACKLKFIAHTAGSIRSLLPSDVFERGIRVSHAAGVISDAVAEMVVLDALLCLRHVPAMDQGLKRGADWLEIRERNQGRLLAAMTVGIVGAGYVGRAVIRLLVPFGCQVLVFDPLLDSEKARGMGVELTDLDGLLRRSDIVSLHAPVILATRGMIGARELGLLRDGAILINTARSALVDDAALMRELQSDRISAVLDVYPGEPLPSDSPWRSCPNAITTPHMAGHTIDTNLRQGDAMVDEVGRFLRGEPLRFGVTQDMLETMA